jgi:mono/diheme cytochrome c family protein
MTNAVVASIERVMRYYREALVLVSMHQTAKLTFKPLILAGALAAFSTCGLAEDTDLGKVAYESNCAACHGQSGKGNGPVSVELRTTPTDLTLIAKRNGGVFPADVLYRIIDGRKTIRAHGTYEMPVWGFVFLRSDSEDAARNRILAIIAYLRSIQLEQ